MILLELFQQPYEKISPEDFKTIVSKLDIDKNYPHRAGSYAAVYRGNDSKIAYKVGRVDQGRTPENDPYLNFLNEIKNTKDPVFPQIYDIKIYQLTTPLTGADITNNQSLQHRRVYFAFIVTMERLRPFQPTWQELEYLWDRYFTVPLYHFDDHGEFISVFINKLGAIAERNTATEEIKDPYAKHFIEVLNPLISTFSNDIYPTNVMMRRTPYGVQPVITDPIC